LSLSNLKQYFAGAGLALGIIILTLQGIEIISLYINSEENTVIFVLKIMPHVIGGYLAGYLVTKNIKGDHLIIGLTTAVLTYIIEMFYFAMLSDKTLSDTWILGSLIISNIAGAFRARTTIIKQNLSNEENKVTK
jgi:hypothetical protein